MLFRALGRDAQGKSLIMKGEKSHFESKTTLRRFIARYLTLLPLKKAAVEIDKRFVDYPLELSDGVTGRIIEGLRRAAFQGLADTSRKVRLRHLQHGCRLLIRPQPGQIAASTGPSVSRT